MKKTILFLYICSAMISSVFAQSNIRIVSLAPSLTQSLYFLEAQNKLVGCTSYCVDGVKDGKEIVASAVTVNLEKVVALKPDIVLASQLTTPDNIATLRRFGIQVEVFQSPKSFAEICEQFIRLGALVGEEARAEYIVNESRQRVEAVSAKMNWRTTPKMFFQIGANPIFTVIPNTFMNDYITLLGAENIAKNFRRGTISREFVIAQNPDYIFVVTMGIVGEEEKNMWGRYPSLSATRNRQIFIIDSDIACQPTPVTFAQTMEILHKLITQ
ncbi:MAG: helical backbone metal receptor [Dysgonamonadaceae bacterium]|jgi:iron complex transport system substrate-binding protein|nr:helical backbone metal receptor [Dysgonamonadaceae bacterium]